MLKTKLIRSALAMAMLTILVTSLVAWQATRDRLPEVIRIATGPKGGLYHRVGRVLGDEIERRTGHSVELVTSQGSVENREQLLAGNCNLAVLQLGSIDKVGIAALSPLYPEVVHVIVRRNRGISSIRDLTGRSLIVGLADSGMRRSANAIIDHYQIQPAGLADPKRHFAQLAQHPERDAAIVTTGFLNPDLTRLLASGEFDLIPILDAKALALRHSYFFASQIPRGLYAARPPLPPEPVETVATIAFLAAAPDASPLLVGVTLRALHESYLQSKIPGLVSPSEAADWSQLALHQAAQGYYDPYRGLGLLTNFMETLSAVKELFFALGAGLYLAWRWWRGLARREVRARLVVQKERLDDFLNQTVAIEEAQMKAQEGYELRAYLDEVTRIKIDAISELTHEELRGNRMFSIFLAQCSSVSRKIEAKLAAIAGGEPFAASRDSDCGFPS